MEFENKSADQGGPESRTARFQFSLGNLLLAMSMMGLLAFVLSHFTFRPIAPFENLDVLIVGSICLGAAVGALTRGLRGLRRGAIWGFIAFVILFGLLWIIAVIHTSFR